MPPLPIFNVRGDSAQQAINAESVALLVNAYPYLRDEITRLRDELNTTRPYRELWEASETERNVVERERDRLRALIARTVVVMDGSWDMLPANAQDQLAEELRSAALTDAPAPQETTE